MHIIKLLPVCLKLPCNNVGVSGYAALHHNDNLFKEICCLAYTLQKYLVFKTFEKGRYLHLTCLQVT